MKVIPPLAITDAMLISSTATETYPTVAWSGASTYAADDIAYVAGAGGRRTAYRSRQSGNLNQPPATSPGWWQNIGWVYPAWSGGATYALGDGVMDPVAHMIYTSLASGNTGNALSDATKWQPNGVTNRWAMFDLLRNSQTVTGSPLNVVIALAERVDAHALIGLEADTATIAISLSGVLARTDVFDLNTRTVLNWYDYYYAPFTRRKALVQFDLPPDMNKTLSLTLEASSGDVACGAQSVGMQFDFGQIEFDEEVDLNNFSTVTRDFEGNVNTMVRRRSIPRTTQQIVVKSENIDASMEMLRRLDATPAIWSGMDDNASFHFQQLLIQGFYEHAPMRFVSSQESRLSLTLMEI